MACFELVIYIFSSDQATSQSFTPPDHGGSFYSQSLKREERKKEKNPDVWEYLKVYSISNIAMWVFSSQLQFVWQAAICEPLLCLLRIHTSIISPSLISCLCENLSVSLISFPSSSLTVHWKEHRPETC